MPLILDLLIQVIKQLNIVFAELYKIFKHTHARAHTLIREIRPNRQLITSVNEDANIDDDSLWSLVENRLEVHAHWSLIYIQLQDSFRIS
jgi:hypothetical protein